MSRRDHRECTPSRGIGVEDLGGVKRSVERSRVGLAAGGSEEEVTRVAEARMDECSWILGATDAEDGVGGGPGPIVREGQDADAAGSVRVPDTTELKTEHRIRYGESRNTTSV